MRELAKHAKMEDTDWQLGGKQLGTFFTVRMSGVAHSWARNAVRLQSAQRRDGTWQSVECDAPGDVPRKVRLYIDLDKSTRQVREEKAARILRHLLRPLLPEGTSLSVNREHRGVSVEGSLIARTVAEAGNLLLVT